MHEIDDKPGFRLPFRKQEQVSVSTPKPAPKASEPRSTSGTTRLALRIILGGALLAATLLRFGRLRACFRKACRKKWRAPWLLTVKTA